MHVPSALEFFSKWQMSNFNTEQKNKKIKIRRHLNEIRSKDCSGS